VVNVYKKSFKFSQKIKSFTSSQKTHFHFTKGIRGICTYFFKKKKFKINNEFILI